MDNVVNGQAPDVTFTLSATERQAMYKELLSGFLPVLSRDLTAINGKIDKVAEAQVVQEDERKALQKRVDELKNEFENIKDGVELKKTGQQLFKEWLFGEERK